MATKKKAVETTQDAFRGTLLKLVGLDFEVKLDDGQNYARVRHPKATQYSNDTVAYTKVHFRDFQDRVEVDGKRVAKSEILDRTVAATLNDIESAERHAEYVRREAERRQVQYDALMASGVADAAKGFTWNRGKYGSANGLHFGDDREGFKATLEREQDAVTLTIRVADQHLPAIAAALKAATKARVKTAA
jgi:hypothetical protein